MSTNYEFKRQTLKQKAILYGIRSLIVISMMFFVYVLAWGNDRDLANLVNAAGCVFTLIWIYTNVLQAKIEIQELFVPPFNTTNGLEFMFIGLICFIAGMFI